MAKDYSIKNQEKLKQYLASQKKKDDFKQCDKKNKANSGKP